jgi:hypothetical protein
MSQPDSPPEGHIAEPPAKRRLLLLTAGALLAGALIVFGAILPAEYNRDPLGIGKVTGLSRLWAPPGVAVETPDAQPPAKEHPVPFRSDVFDIPLAPGGDPDRRHALEFKVRMKAGETLVYAWAAEGLGAPDDLLYDFHGHTVSAPGSEAPVSVSAYKKAAAASAQGALNAPLDGIHGWYFRNRSSSPVKVRVRLAGYYELIPSGEEGNLGGIAPKL